MKKDTRVLIADITRRDGRVMLDAMRAAEGMELDALRLHILALCHFSLAAHRLVRPVNKEDLS